MPTFSVLYAADIPYYVTFDVQAANSEEAVIVAKAKISSGNLLLEDPDWDGSILERIVHIEDEKGNAIINDLPSITTGSRPSRRRQSHRDIASASTTTTATATTSQSFRTANRSRR